MAGGVDNILKEKQGRKTWAMLFNSSGAFSTKDQLRGSKWGSQARQA